MNRLMHYKTGMILIAAMLAFASTPLFAQQGQGAASGADLNPGLDSGLAWSDITAVRLDVEFPGDGYHASWLLNRCDCGDLLIESELNVPGEVEKGELLLVGQRAVLERGFRSEELETQMSWDAPALMLQLAGQLLARSIPGGPASVVQKTIVSVNEETEGIALDSGNAVGGFPAPWEVTTMAEPLADGKRRFDLQFSFAIPGSTDMAHMRLKGTADYSERDFPLGGETPLNDWKVTWRDENDVARTMAGVDTLEELRAVIGRTTRESSDTPPQ